MAKIIQLKHKRTDDEAERLEVYLRLQKLKEHAERKRATKRLLTKADDLNW
jgi:hypothetical protein